MFFNEVFSVCGCLFIGYVDVEVLQIFLVELGCMFQYLLVDCLVVEGIDKFVLVGCIGFYFLVGCLYDMMEIMMVIYIEFDIVLFLLEKCMEFIFCYCLVIKEIGVVGVIMVELVVGFFLNEDC